MSRIRSGAGLLGLLKTLTGSVGVWGVGALGFKWLIFQVETHPLVCPNERRPFPALNRWMLSLYLDSLTRTAGNRLISGTWQGNHRGLSWRQQRRGQNGITSSLRPTKTVRTFSSLDIVISGRYSQTRRVTTYCSGTIRTNGD